MTAASSEVRLDDRGHFDHEHYTYDPALLEQPADDLWTMDRIRAWVAAGKMRTEVIVPDDTIPITWNGCRVWITAGVEIEIPSPHAELYRQSRKTWQSAANQAKQVLDNRAFVAGGTVMDSGWNGNDGR